jgi:hypothetical protein
MVSYGQVIGGQYMNASVVTNYKGDLVVQYSFKKRKLTADEVSEWEEMFPESRGSAVAAVGQAIAGAALPGFVGKMASAALGATVDVTKRPPRTIRVDWSDGKQSLIKLPESLFTHLAVVLREQRIESTTARPIPEIVAPTPDVAGQIFAHLSGFLKDRHAEPAGTTASNIPQLDVTEHIVKLAALHEQGILTDDEFATKKAELLARL